MVDLKFFDMQLGVNKKIENQLNQENKKITKKTKP